LEFVDEDLFSHILNQNRQAETALLDWTGLGKYKQKVFDLLKTTDLKVIKL
jgi:D-aminoacyl-tRNA deacylase